MQVLESEGFDAKQILECVAIGFDLVVSGANGQMNVKLP